MTLHLKLYLPQGRSWWQRRTTYNVTSSKRLPRVPCQGRAAPCSRTWGMCGAKRSRSTSWAASPIAQAILLQRAYYEESLRLFQEQRDVPDAALILSSLQTMVSTQSDQQMARSLDQQLQRLMQQARNRGALGLFLINMGDMWLHR